MQLSENTIVKLRELINEETGYRSGPKLVKFLSDLVLVIRMARDFPQDGYLRRIA